LAASTSMPRCSLMVLAGSPADTNPTHKGQFQCLTSNT
jgi:hypothetical protein